MNVPSQTREKWRRGIWGKPANTEWKEGFSEEKDTVPTLLPSRRTPNVINHFKASKEVGEWPAIVNGHSVERARRRILVDDVDVVAPLKSVSDGIVYERHVNSPELKPPSSSKDISSSSKRPRSLPELGKYIPEDHSVDSAVPYNGKESVVLEDRRLKSLALASRRNLQKGSPVSRSLNSISDVQSEVTSFRDKFGVRTDVIADLRNNPIQHRSPGRTAECSKRLPDKQSGGASIKRSCVRRLNLDVVSSLPQDSVSVEKYELQPAAERLMAGVGSSKQIVSERATSKLALKKPKLNSSTVSQHNDEHLHSNLRSTSKENTVIQSKNTPGISKDFPVGSQQYRIGPETQRVLMNNFEDDSFCISEKSKGDSSECVTSSKNASIVVLVDACKERVSEINHEADNVQTSEELFRESQGSVHGECSESDKAGQRNELGSSQRTESLYYNLKCLSTISSNLHKKSHFQPQGLKFTKSQIKSMCDVISRLYSASK